MKPFLVGVPTLSENVGGGYFFLPAPKNGYVHHRRYMDLLRPRYPSEAFPRGYNRVFFVFF